MKDKGSQAFLGYRTTMMVLNQFDSRKDLGSQVMTSSRKHEAFDHEARCKKAQEG
jgi:hypothetical protein